MGASGLSVSRLALGTMTWGRSTDYETASEQLRTFLSSGGTLVDTAHGYGDGDAETFLGRMIDEEIDRRTSSSAPRRASRGGRASAWSTSRGSA